MARRRPCEVGPVRPSGIAVRRLNWHIHCADDLPACRSQKGDGNGAMGVRDIIAREHSSQRRPIGTPRDRRLIRIQPAIGRAPDSREGRPKRRVWRWNWLVGAWLGQERCAASVWSDRGGGAGGCPGLVQRHQSSDDIASIRGPASKGGGIEHPNGMGGIAASRDGGDEARLPVRELIALRQGRGGRRGECGGLSGCDVAIG